MMAGRLDDGARLRGVEAVTLDFYETLVYPHSGRGRGEILMEFLAARGIESAPWEHRVLYDVFEPHGREYAPAASRGERLHCRRRLAERVFRRLGVADPERRAREHADDLWEILGPPAFRVFDEVPGTLSRLTDRGLPLAVVSNWQKGLRHFCAELGLLAWFDHVVVSAEVGSQKPDPGIFHEACRRLGKPAAAVLHVGDRPVDDLEGARGAGLQALLIDRGGTSGPSSPSVDGLDEIPGLIA